jgi:site-specific recombinase XerD
MGWSRARLEISGPLASYFSGFTQWLSRQGYEPAVVRIHQRRMIHLSAWLRGQRTDLRVVGVGSVEAFLATEHAAGRFVHWRSGGWVPLLRYLREAGVLVTDPSLAPRSPVEELLDRFAAYLATERGLSARTIDRDKRAVEPFVAAMLPHLTCMTAAEVTAFVVQQAERNPRSVPHLVSPLRSLLRFLHAEGITGVAGLTAAVPSVARWKLAGLPKAVPSSQVAALLSSCDLTTQVGQRDAAILTVLVRLGLRIGEVARLRLTDIDWRAGELVVTGKGPQSERLPLPTDVGEAIVSYLLAARPCTDVREVFLCAYAPYRPMSRGAVTNVVARAARRAGLGVMHAHRLRHSAATEMLNAGASLQEIGQVLRHRDALTTSVYAKVDIAGLRAVARPWPAGSTS